MATANGKVILFGEHAVVYGYPAVAAGITRGAEATATSAQTSTICVNDVTAEAKQGKLGEAYFALLTALRAPATQAQAQLKIPAGCGLGASAAVGVAVARAVLEHYSGSCTLEESPDVLSRAAHAWETVFHGNPSGVDAAAAMLGGCLLFDKQRGPRPIALGQKLTLALAQADAPASTQKMVSQVAELHARSRTEIDAVFERIGQIANHAQLAMRDGCLEQLGALMSENHALLRQLAVSTASLDQACTLAMGAGALGAKLTGSGGGGCVVALCAGDPSPVLQAWSRAGLPSFPAEIPACNLDQAA